MKNRQRLRDCGLALIIFGILDLFVFVGTIIDSLVDGTVAEGLANVEADILVAVKVVLIIFAVFLGVLVAADIFLGIKAIKVSQNPDASKGHIIVAKVFLILSAIATVSCAISIFGNSPSVVDSILNVANSTLSVAIYTLFVVSAEAVRKDVIDGNQ